MRMMLKVSIPAEQGNKAMNDGTLAKTMTAFVEKAKPEACYFLPHCGKRTAFFFFDLQETSQIPPVAESFFTALNADVEMTPAMNLDDLKRGLQSIPR